MNARASEKEKSLIIKYERALVVAGQVDRPTDFGKSGGHKSSIRDSLLGQQQSI